MVDLYSNALVEHITTNWNSTVAGVTCPWITTFHNETKSATYPHWKDVSRIVVYEPTEDPKRGDLGDDYYLPYMYGEFRIFSRNDTAAYKYKAHLYEILKTPLSGFKKIKITGVDPNFWGRSKEDSFAYRLTIEMRAGATDIGAGVMGSATIPESKAWMPLPFVTYQADGTLTAERVWSLSADDTHNASCTFNATVTFAGSVRGTPTFTDTTTFSAPLTSSATLQFMPSGDTDDYLEMSSDGTYPWIKHIGGPHLFVGTDDTGYASIAAAENISQFIAIRYNKASNYGCLWSTDNLNLFINGVTSDYLQLRTVTNVPWIDAIGACGMVIASDGTSAITIDASGEVTKIGQDTPASGDSLAWNNTTGTWVAKPAAGGVSVAFRDIVVTGSATVVADSATDLLTLVAGSNMTITTNATTDTITFEATGGGGGVNGSGTADYVAKWTAGTTLGDSSIQDTGALITFGATCTFDYPINVTSIRHSGVIPIMPNGDTDDYLEFSTGAGNLSTIKRIGGAWTDVQSDNASYVGWRLYDSATQYSRWGFEKTSHYAFLDSTGPIYFITGATAVTIATSGDVTFNHTAIFSSNTTGISHADLSNATAGSHHAQAHAIDGSDHTASGLTQYHFLRADSATAFSFQTREFTIGACIVNVTTGYKTVWRSPFSCSVAKLQGRQKAGTNTVINARKNGTSDVLTADLTLNNSNTWYSSTSVQGTTWSADDWLEVEVVTVGSATEITIQVEFTEP